MLKYLSLLLSWVFLQANQIHDAIMEYEESDLIEGGKYAAIWDKVDEIDQEADTVDIEDYIDRRLEDSTPMLSNGRARSPGRDQAIAPTYLHLAAIRHRSGLLCQQLIERGADLKHEMEISGRFHLFHLTPYQVAVYFGNAHCLRVMLPRLRPRDLSEELSTATPIISSTAAASGEKASTKGGTLLAHAADGGYFDIYQMLIKAGARPDPASFLYAVQRNHLDMVTYILRDLRIDVNYKMTEDPLKQHVDVAESAVLKADSALHSAAERGYVAMAELLIRYGAHVNCVTPKDQMRPLDVALEVLNGACRKYSDYRARVVNCTGISEVIQLLQRYGANPAQGKNRKHLLNTSYGEHLLAEREQMLVETFGERGMPKPIVINVTDDDKLRTDEEAYDWDAHDELERQAIETKERSIEELQRQYREEREAQIRKWNDMPDEERERIQNETLAGIAPGAQSLENQIKRAIKNNPNGEIERKMKRQEDAMRKADEMAAANSRRLLEQIERDNQLRGERPRNFPRQDL